MDNKLAGRLNQAIKSLQHLVGEAVTINLITYPCIVGGERIDQDLVEGGYKAVSHVSISLALSDVLCSPVAPAIGNTALIVSRERTYRVNGISPTQTTYELDLIDVTT